jgi:DnaJ-class molecular chaperone
VALREKYQNRDYLPDEANIAKEKVMSVGGEVKDMTEDFKKLAGYAVCKACQGQGIQKSMYNHRVMESNCEACDGEGIIRTTDE